MSLRPQSRLSTLAPLVRAADPTDAHDPVPTDLVWARIEERLRSDDPAATVLGEGDDPETSGHRPRRGVLVAAAAALVLAAGAAVLVPRTQDPAYAVTPPLLTTTEPVHEGAADRMRAIADDVRDLPDDSGTGTGVRVETSMWSLFTRYDGKTVHNKVVPYDWTTVVSPSGSRTVTTDYELDGIDDDVSTSEGSPVRPIPVDPAALAARMDEGNLPGRGASGRFAAVVEALLETPVQPDERAALLDYLAGSPRLATVGRLDDRLGRPGIGFTVQARDSGLATQYLLVVDPDDGRVLDYEETLTGDPGMLDVRTPAVIEYVAWRESVFTD